jgi:hypothetical protein
MVTAKKVYIKKALLIVAISYLLYNIYQASITTMFVVHFPLAISRLANFIESSQPTLQVGLFMFQEASASIGVYLRLAAGAYAVYSAFLLNKGDTRYLKSAKKALLLEALYFALLIPAAINQSIGFFISSGPFLDIKAGVSSLLQALLIFPPLFILSRGLKEPLGSTSNVRLAGFATSMYLFGLWLKHGFIWLIAFSSTMQAGLWEAVGSVNSWLTLLLAAILLTVAWVTCKHKKTLHAASLLGVSAYFVVYLLVSIWVPLYFSFLPLIEFWMVSLLILAIALLLDSRKQDL